MPGLPVVSGRRALRAFTKVGWEHRRTRGDHLIMIKRGMRWNLSVPDHRELAPGTLHKLIRRAGLTVDEFVKLLD